MTTKNIMIVGVGGQGSVLASKLLGHLLMNSGYDVKVSEFARESGVPCIADEWQEPVMPLPVPEDVHDIEIMIKFAHGQTQN